MFEQHTPEGIPAGWSTRAPDERDIAALAELRAAISRAATGTGSPNVSGTLSEVVEMGSWTRRQIVAVDQAGTPRAWAQVQDRAAGRSLTAVNVDPTLPDEVADPLAAGLFAWCEKAAAVFAELRDLEGTQIDTGSYEGDTRQHRWLEAAGFENTRRWFQMSRPVSVDEAQMPELREGVEIRRVRRRPNGLPFAEDVQAVHWVLEKSFEDHYNAYRESFPEFVGRLQEETGHAWDHWWLATVRTEDGIVPGGAIVSTMLPPDASGRYGTYIDYIGVHRDARGRGIAKALLRTVIADAASRGRGRVGLEVDATSPTGADGLYTSLGWETQYVTESWHRDIVV